MDESSWTLRLAPPLQNSCGNIMFMTIIISGGLRWTCIILIALRRIFVRHSQEPYPSGHSGGSLKKALDVVQSSDHFALYTVLSMLSKLLGFFTLMTWFGQFFFTLGYWLVNKGAKKKESLMGLEILSKCC